MGLLIVAGTSFLVSVGVMLWLSAQKKLVLQEKLLAYLAAISTCFCFYATVNGVQNRYDPPLEPGEKVRVLAVYPQQNNTVMWVGWNSDDSAKTSAAHNMEKRLYAQVVEGYDPQKGSLQFKPGDMMILGKNGKLLPLRETSDAR